MSQQLVQIDAFSAEPFAGNPAAVCLLESAADEVWMQKVAAEMNLSETAFLYPQAGGYHLRWFTPAAEVKLCGHATLASAHFLFEDGHVSEGEAIKFQTLSGQLIARKKGEWIELDFPAGRTAPAVPSDNLLAIVGGKMVACERDSGGDLVVQLASEQLVRSLAPNFAAIAELPGGSLLVTAEASMPEVDFVSRYFAPGYGIDEDPVTGSAHTLLGPFWADRLGKKEFTAYQASTRGGFVGVRLAGERVFLSGQAVTVMRAELL